MIFGERNKPAWQTPTPGSDYGDSARSRRSLRGLLLPLVDQRNLVAHPAQARRNDLDLAVPVFVALFRFRQQPVVDGLVDFDFGTDRGHHRAAVSHLRADLLAGLRSARFLQKSLNGVDHGKAEVTKRAGVASSTLGMARGKLGALEL